MTARRPAWLPAIALVRLVAFASFDGATSRQGMWGIDVAMRLS
jgi:hypothetical protein